jgi:hypothetical protein
MAGWNLATENICGRPSERKWKIGFLARKLGAFICPACWCGEVDVPLATMEFAARVQITEARLKARCSPLVFPNRSIRLFAIDPFVRLRLYSPLAVTAYAATAEAC